LLNYSKLEAGHIEYDLTDVTMDSVVKRVVPMVEPQASAKNLEVVYSPRPEAPPARADRARAEQIVLNLLANAVKFTPAGGRVEVVNREEQQRAIVSVIDTGPGVPPEQQSAIFEPFVQIGRSLTSGHEGTGLGLAISRDLARGMHGDVTVMSGPESGATFTLFLPIEDG